MTKGDRTAYGVCVCGFNGTLAPSLSAQPYLPQQWQGRVIRATITVIITILQLTVDRVAICDKSLFDCEKGLTLTLYLQVS